MPRSVRSSRWTRLVFLLPLLLGGQVRSTWGQTGADPLPTATDRHADPAARRAALQILASNEQPVSPDIFSSLFELLTDVPEELEQDLASALARHAVRGSHLRQIQSLALDRTGPASRRRVALLCLGQQRTLDAARTLIRNLEDTRPDPLRGTVFTALEQMTGLTTLGHHSAAWQAWWNQHRRDSETQWLAHLLENQLRRAAIAEAAQPRVREQLIQTQRQLYRATPEADRSALLASWLGDEQALPATKLLALDLAVKLLTDNQPIGPELRAALIRRLEDPLEPVRAKSATLLRDLADEDAADAVTRRLLDDAEAAVSVLRPCLQLLSRLPRTMAIGPALQFLHHPELRGEAASVLTACADAGLLSALQSSIAAQTVRAQSTGLRPPAPQFVELLGRLGDQEDWARIEGWLSSPDDAIKLAAARAWAQSDRSLETLAQHAGDDLLRPIVIVAATRRGNRTGTMLALIEHKPQQEQLAAAWQRALLAMAGRVDPALGLLHAVQTLARQGLPPAFREQMLTEAINRLLPLSLPAGVTQPQAGAPQSADAYATTLNPDPATLVQLLLARAAVRLEAGNPAAALNDFERIAALQQTLDEATKRKVDLGVLEARLGLGDVEAATEHAARMLSAARLVATDLPHLTQAVARLFLDAATRVLAAGQVDAARTLTRRLRALIRDAAEIDPELLARLSEIERQVRAGAEPAAEAPAPDHTTPAVQSSPRAGNGG